VTAPDEPGAAPQPVHWTQFANGGALLALAALAITGARASLRLSWLLAPAAGVLVVVAVLAGWGAAIQLSGGTHTDDHPWV